MHILPPSSFVRFARSDSAAKFIPTSITQCVLPSGKKTNNTHVTTQLHGMYYYGLRFLCTRRPYPPCHGGCRKTNHKPRGRYLLLVLVVDVGSSSSLATAWYLAWLVLTCNNNNNINRCSLFEKKTHSLSSLKNRECVRPCEGFPILLQFEIQHVSNVDAFVLHYPFGRV